MTVAEVQIIIEGNEHEPIGTTDVTVLEAMQRLKITKIFVDAGRQVFYRDPMDNKKRELNNGVRASVLSLIEEKLNGQSAVNAVNGFNASDLTNPPETPMEFAMLNINAQKITQAFERQTSLQALQKTTKNFIDQINQNSKGAEGLNCKRYIFQYFIYRLVQIYLANQTAPNADQLYAQIFAMAKLGAEEKRGFLLQAEISILRESLKALHSQTSMPLDSEHRALQDMATRALLGNRLDEIHDAVPNCGEINIMIPAEEFEEMIRKWQEILRSLASGDPKKLKAAAKAIKAEIENIRSIFAQLNEKNRVVEAFAEQFYKTYAKQLVEQKEAKDVKPAETAEKSRSKRSKSNSDTWDKFPERTREYLVNKIKELSVKNTQYLYDFLLELEGEDEKTIKIAIARAKKMHGTEFILRQNSNMTWFVDCEEVSKHLTQLSENGIVHVDILRAVFERPELITKVLDMLEAQLNS